MRTKVIVVWLILSITVSIFALTGFGESQVFEITESTLPVELSSFTATLYASSNVQISWVTQSETAVLGFLIYRSLNSQLNQAMIVSPMIPATNSSSQHSYGFKDSNLQLGERYYYWLQSIDLDGSESFSGPLTVYIESGDESGAPQISPKDGLLSIYPNPFNPSTTISFYASGPTHVELSVYGIKGQLLRKFQVVTEAAGIHTQVFDGRDQKGSDLSSGLYFVRMISDQKQSQQKMLLLK